MHMSAATHSALACLLVFIGSLAGCTESVQEGVPEAREDVPSQKSSPDASAAALEPCAAIVFEGRRYLLTHRPEGAGPGVGRPLGTAEATGCRPMRVEVYSVNEQSKDEALTVSDGKTVWLYTATRP